MRKKTKHITLLGLSFSLVATLGLIQRAELKATDQKEYITSLDSYQKQEEINMTSRLRVFRDLPSFGFRNTMANWAFVQFLLYFGDDEARQASGYKLNPDFFEGIVEHDPFFTKFYIFLSGSVTTYSGLPERTVEIMDKGLNHLAPNKPVDSYYVWRYKAADELLFLGKGSDAQHSYEMAAKWAAQSKDVNSSLISQLSSQTASFLSKDPDSKIARIDSWASILTSALDDNTRKRAISKIQELGGNVIIAENGQLQIEYSKAEGGLDDRDI